MHVHVWNRLKRRDAVVLPHSYAIWVERADDCCRGAHRCLHNGSPLGCRQVEDRHTVLNRNDKHVPLPALLVGNDEGNNVVSVQDRARPRPGEILTERARLRRRKNQGHTPFSSIEAARTARTECLSYASA
jgi:hypothetical protein